MKYAMEYWLPRFQSPDQAWKAYDLLSSAFYEILDEYRSRIHERTERMRDEQRQLQLPLGLGPPWSDAPFPT